MNRQRITSATVEDPMIALPEQVPAQDGMAEIPGAKLGYWDTGGSGDPIVLLHPASGSALTWLYQQPAFAGAGYRVSPYSRRNYYNSDSAPAENPGTGSLTAPTSVNFSAWKNFMR